MKALYFDRDVARALAAQALGKVRKDLAFSRLSPVHYGEVPEPQLPGPDWVKVANAECGLCGTDVRLMFMDIEPRTFVAALPTLPRTYLGHEVWGRVSEAGPLAAKSFAVGDRVALRVPRPSCSSLGVEPACRQCRTGSFALCENVVRGLQGETSFTAGLDGKRGHGGRKEHAAAGTRSKVHLRRRKNDGNDAVPGEAAASAADTAGGLSAEARDCGPTSAQRQSPSDTGAGFSPVMVVHESQLFRLPDDLDDQRAVLLEPTAVAVHSVLRRLPSPGSRVLVVGGGSLGLLILAVLRQYAPETELHCLARYDVQAAMAEWLGAIVHRPSHRLASELARATGACHVQASLGNRVLLGGFDVVYDAVGSSQSVNGALRWVRGRGTVVLVGVSMRTMRLDLTPVWHQEIDLLGVDSHATESDGRTSFAHAATLLADPDFPVEGLITHRLPMDSWQEAVRAFVEKKRSGALKVVLQHRQLQ